MEAKARKKRREMRIMERLKAQTERIADDDEMTEGAKVQHTSTNISTRAFLIMFFF